MSRTLIIGDVHACAHELRKLITKTNPTKMYLLGDLFTKGPDPVGVWRVIQERKIQSILGNHDAWLLKIIDGEVAPRERHQRIIDKMNTEAPGWIEWLRALPLFIELPNFTLVHAGLHINGELESTSKEMAILMRHWPIDNLNAPHWHELYEGEKGVIFGHDARRGLVYKRKAGKPFLIGLDSGCVYGQKLTGYLLEADELHQVSAARIYQSIYV